MLESRPEPTGDLRRRLVVGATGSSALSVGNTLLLFVTTSLLTHLLGARNYGVYAQVAAWLQIFTVIVVPGIDQVTKRDVAVFMARGQLGHVRGLIKFGNRTVRLIVLWVLPVGMVVIWGSYRSHGISEVFAFWLGLIALPFGALSKVRGSVLLGFRRVVLAQMPELLFRPLLFLAAIVALDLVHSRSYTPAILASSCTYVAAYLLGVALVRMTTPTEVAVADPVYERRTWMRSSRHFFFMSATSAITSQIGVVLLGLLSSSSNAGLFAVANRGSSIILLGFTAVTAAVGPNAARLWALGDTARLQRVVAVSTRATAAFAVPVTVVFIVFGRQLLSLFGGEFRHASLALAILSVGQLATSVTGVVSALILMAGEERRGAVIFGFGAAVNVVLDCVLIPATGLLGAAIGSAVGLVVSELLLVYVAKKYLGIRLTLTGRIK